jgi:hypothetical protein
MIVNRMQRGVKRYEHVQGVASDTWNVVHNLNKELVVSDVYIEHNGNNEKIIPMGVDMVDADSIVIRWSKPMTGVARIG